ncbi:MAG: hypothetical protein ACI9JN_000367 [Bacteroidia bacterium]|jgi:hypothetical protein
MKRLVTLFFTLAFLLISFKSFTYRSGGVQGYTNAPSENNCTSCHTGIALNKGSGSTSDMTLTNVGGATGYEPDSTYTLKLKYKQSSITRFGFSITALDTSKNEPAGSFTITSSRTQKRTKTYSGKTRQYVEHTNAGTVTTSTNTAEWEFKWTAPSSKKGTIKFYATVNATNASGTNAGDQIYAKVFDMKMAGFSVASAGAKDTMVCAGETVSLLGSGTNTPTAYSWVFPDGTPSVSTKQNPTTSYSGFGKKYAILKVQNAVGWSDADTQVINVIQSPTAYIPGSAKYTICPGDSVKLIANFKSGSTYNWSTGYTGGNIIYAKAAGDYYVTVKAGDCSRVSNIITINHYKVPVPTITTSNNSDSVCESTPITLTAKTGYDSLIWYSNLVQIGKSTSNTFLVNVDSGASYTVRGWSTDGCLSVFSDSIEYEVIPKDEGLKVECTNREPFSVTYDWTGIFSHNGVQVSIDKGKSWVTPSSGSMGNIHKMVGLDPEEDYEVWTRAITQSPCFYSNITKQVCRTGKCSPLEVTITVDSNICKGDDVDIEINGLANEKYALAFEGGGSFTDTIFKFSPQTEGDYTIFVTDSNFIGCPPKKLTFPIHIDNISDLSFKTDKVSNTYCTGDTIKFTASSGNDTYKFFVNDKLRATLSDSFYYEDKFNDGDSAYVEVTKRACKGSSEKIFLSVIPTPIATFTFTNAGSDYSFKPDNTNYKSYFWEFGDGFTSVLMEPDHNYKTSSNSTVDAQLEVTDNNDCEAVAVKKVDVPDFSSVEAIAKAGLKMYPSPVQNTLFVEWTNKSEALTRVNIYTVDGHNVAMFTNYHSAFSLDLSNIAAGLYIIEIQSDEIVLRQRLIKN